MAKKMSNIPLIVAILAAGVLISGALVFLATQMGAGFNTDNFKTAVFDNIDDYIETKQDEAREAAETAQAEKPTFVEEDMTDDDAMLGEADAPVTIVEFSDFQCPYCSKFYNGAYQEIKEKYVETGKVKFVYRDMPLGFHEGAFPAALAAECVRDQLGDEVFFEMHNYLYENQGDLSGSKEGIAKNLLAEATNLGVNVDEFKSCYENNKFQEEISKDASDASSIGITGTPSFLINGQILIGAYPFDAFAEIIEKELAK